MAGKKFWRCTVCGDIHFGMAGPEICPTCKQKNVYVESNAAEAKKLMGL
jgi:rubrerythrin